jgi:capsule biosynthesis phosphatase
MRIVLDLDGTLTIDDPEKAYSDKEINLEVLQKVKEFKAAGFEIVINTARNMRTYQNSIGKITANTVPIIIEWLNRNGVPYDEIIVGKPWCGEGGFYVDDKAIRPDEFAKLTYDEIITLVGSASPQ